MVQFDSGWLPFESNSLDWSTQDEDELSVFAGTFIVPYVVFC